MSDILDILALLFLFAAAWLFITDVKRALRGMDEDHVWADSVHRDHWGFTMIFGAVLFLSAVCWVWIVVVFVRRVFG